MFGKKNSAGAGGLIPKDGGAFANTGRSPEAKDNFRSNKSGASFKDAKLETADYALAKRALLELLMERLDFSQLEMLTPEGKRARIGETIDQLVNTEIQTPLTSAQQALLREQAVDDLLGFGPLEVLLADPDVSDIMINGSKQIGRAHV